MIGGAVNSKRQRLPVHQKPVLVAPTTSRRPKSPDPTAVRRSVARIERGRKLPTLIARGVVAGAPTTIKLIPRPTTGSPTLYGLISRPVQEGVREAPTCLVAGARHHHKSAGKAPFVPMLRFPIHLGIAPRRATADRLVQT
jgi:hypothetical protein